MFPKCCFDRLKNPREEIETVGLKGNRKYTDSKIRKEHGWGKRVKY